MTFSIQIDDLVFAGVDIDWTTWNLDIAPASGTSVTLRTDAQGDHYIDYVIPVGTDPDTFSWHICDINGNCSNATYYTVILVCEDVPSLAADAENAVCGQVVTIDVLLNDTANAVGGFAPETVQIEDGPDFGVVSFNPDGTINYTPIDGYSGVDTFTYLVMNANGEWATSAATVTVTVICAGLATAITVC
jgi:hypothetical protein